mmetsp:Transcript_49191/g.145212  ORF Transcript_49191/g.145212 Transcript_49191/m.145212 type:complete len:201 (-) Transcript_49191:76-678(-)
MPQACGAGGGPGLSRAFATSESLATSAAPRAARLPPEPPLTLPLALILATLPATLLCRLKAALGAPSAPALPTPTTSAHGARQGELPESSLVCLLRLSTTLPCLDDLLRSSSSSACATCSATSRRSFRVFACSRDSWYSRTMIPSSSGLSLSVGDVAPGVGDVALCCCICDAEVRLSDSDVEHGFFGSLCGLRLRRGLGL